MKSLAAILGVILCLSGSVQAQATAAKGCSLALAFALDVSSSVDEVEHQLQRAGLASALRDPEVQTAILSRAAPVTTVITRSITTVLAMGTFWGFMGLWIACQ